MSIPPLDPAAAFPAPTAPTATADDGGARGPDRLREAALAFESMLVQMMLRSMREAQLENGLFGEGPGSSTYEGMFDTHLSEALAEGSPLGIADVLEDRWRRALDRGEPVDPAAPERALDRARRALDAYAAAEESP